MEQRRGDPEGRRIALRRAKLLSEAARVARVLQVLTERAGESMPEIDAIERSLVRREHDHLLRGRGRLDPRDKFNRRSGHRLYEEREINLLFADESGSPGPRVIAEDDCFAIGAVAMDAGQEATYRVAADRLKLDFFGTTDLTFHEPEMRAHEGR
jgi:hypothetical protein